MMIEPVTTLGWVLFFMCIGVITLMALIFYRQMTIKNKDDEEG